MKINILLKNKVIILIFLIFFTIFYSGKIYAMHTPVGEFACRCGYHRECEVQCVLGPCPNGEGVCCVDKRERCHFRCNPCPPSSPNPPTPPPPQPKTQYVCNLSSHTCYKCSGDYCPSPSFSTMSQCQENCGNWVQVKKCVPGFLGIGRICNPSPCRDVPPGTCKDTCQTNADCSGSPPVNQETTTPPTTCIPCSCPCTYNCCRGNCCGTCPGTYDCCCGTRSCHSDECSPFPPYINSFSIYPNRLFTNQAFNISYQATRKNVCSNTISCSVEGKYLGHNCGQKNVLNICPSSESQRLRVWDPNNQLLKLSKSSSGTVSASISLTPTIDFWGKYQYTLTCDDGCYRNSQTQTVFVLPVLYYQESPFSSILQPFISLINGLNLR